jgi:hypothetical protein
VLEWEVQKVPGDWAEKLNIMMRDNYGLAGPVYLEWLVSHRDEAAAMADQIEAHMRKAMNYRTEERFWFAAAAAMYAGGYFARQLGLIAFDPFNSMPWFAQQLDKIRGVVMESHSTGVDALAEYLDATVDQRLVIQFQTVGSREVVTPVKVPTRAFTARLELTQRPTLYLAISPFRRWLMERGLTPTRVIEELRVAGVYKGSMTRRLGAGVPALDTGPSKCWIFSLDTDALRDRISS